MTGSPRESERAISSTLSSAGGVVRTRFFTTKGLSIIVTGLVLIVALCRADPKDIPKIVETVFESRSFAATGWISAVVVFLASGVVLRFQRRTMAGEIERLARERDALQERLLGPKT